MMREANESSDLERDERTGGATDASLISEKERPRTPGEIEKEKQIIRAMEQVEDFEY